MFEAVERQEIAAPIERVWAVVSEVSGHARLAGSGEVKGIRMSAPLVPGAVFEGDIVVGGVRSFTSRNVVEMVEAPTKLSWRSYPPLDEGETPDHQIEVEWWFELAPSGHGTSVEHGFRAPLPKANPEEFRAFMEKIDRVSTVRAGMQQTLANLAELATS